MFENPALSSGLRELTREVSPATVKAAVQYLEAMGASLPAIAAKAATPSSAAAPSTARNNTPVQLWEYTTVVATDPLTSSLKSGLDSDLGQRGEQGWELVQ